MGRARLAFARSALLVGAAALGPWLLACGGASTSPSGGGAPSSDVAPSTPGGPGSPSGGGGGGGGGATSQGGGPSTSGNGADGAPTRQACTSSFGNAITTAHGRLDGRLVSIVGTHDSHCNGDATHLHLQIEVGGAAYDVAVNVDGLEGETDAAVPGGPWTEGWHPSVALDYVKDLGLHSDAMALSGTSQLRAHLETALATANHVSVFATGYGGQGVHLVHRNGSGRDGAVVIDALSDKPHLFVFRFSNEAF